MKEWTGYISHGKAEAHRKPTTFHYEAIQEPCAAQTDLRLSKWDSEWKHRMEATII